MDITACAKKFGLYTCVAFDPRLLVPETRIREFCIQNRCGSYGKNHMCPPLIGTLEEIAERLKGYEHGLLLQYVKEMEVDKKNAKAILKTKNEFHERVLEVEGFLRKNGIEQMWGMIGGNCGLCRTCKAVKGRPCKHPDKARPSLEAIGVDVIGLLEKLGQDSGFHKDRITWTGVVLYNE